MLDWTTHNLFQPDSHTQCFWRKSIYYWLYIVGKRAVKNVTNKYSKAFAMFLGLLYYPMQIIMEININNFLFAFCSTLIQIRMVRKVSCVVFLVHPDSLA